jgi:serine protease
MGRSGLGRIVWACTWLALAACRPLAADPGEHAGFEEDAERTDCIVSSSGVLAPVRLRTRAPPSVAPHPDGRLPALVRFRSHGGGTRRPLPAPELLEDVVRRSGGSLRSAWPAFGVASVRVTAKEWSALAQQPEVASVEPDRLVRALGLPEAGAFFVCGGPKDAGAGPGGAPAPHLRLVQAPEVWDADGDGLPDVGRPTGEGVRVCVIDSGIDLLHPALRSAYLAGRDFIDGDDEPLDVDAQGLPGTGHGTHVAGILAAQPGAQGVSAPRLSSSGSVLGVAPGVRLLVARVLDEEGNGSVSSVIAALSWCQQMGAHIVSMSLGAPEPTAAEAAAVAEAWRAGMLLVAASGNAGDLQGLPGGAKGVTFPAGYPQVIAVGAVAQDCVLAPFSQKGTALSLVAPGVDVPSTLPRGTVPFAELELEGAPLDAEPADGSGAGEYAGPLTDCGDADSPTSCGQPPACSSFLALVRRTGGPPADQVARVRAQGAGAVLLVDDAGAPAPEGPTPPVKAPGEPWPLVASVRSELGERLRLAQGRHARVSVRGADYGLQSGTSAAAPLVAGVAALLLGAHPGLSPAQLREVLEASARDLGPAGSDPSYGHGLVQARDALDALATPGAPTPGSPRGLLP